MTRTKKTNLKEGKRLAAKYPSVANFARQSTINDMCQGENDTDFNRALANCFLDFQEGKISKEEYDRLTGHLTKSKVEDVIAGNKEFSRTLPGIIRPANI